MNPANHNDLLAGGREERRISRQGFKRWMEIYPGLFDLILKQKSPALGVTRQQLAELIRHGHADITGRDIRLAVAALEWAPPSCSPCSPSPT